MWRSWRRRGVYLAVGCTASAMPAVGCDERGDTADSGDVEAAVFVPLAQAESLAPLSTAPAVFWRLAHEWSAAEAECPSRIDDGARYTLRGGCTLADGRALGGEVTVDEVPDGGTWSFAAMSLDGLRVDGMVAWVRTDEANTLTAWELEAGAGQGSATYSSFVATLDEAGAWRSAGGRARWRHASVATTGQAALQAPAGCAAPGSGRWESDAELVEAELVDEACGCSAWSAGANAGEWCPD